MAKVGGTEVNVGLGIEATAGTGVTPTVYPQWNDLSVQATSEKAMHQAQRGVRNTTSDSMIRRKYSEGSIGVTPDVDIMPYFFGMALGSVSSSTDDPEAGANTHTITVQNTHNSMKTATIVVEQGGEVTEEFTNCVCNSLNFEVSDGYATASMEILGGFPTTGGSLTESYTNLTKFAYHNMEARFGSDVSTAQGANATQIKSFSLNVANNVLLDEAFLSGSNEPVSGGFIAGRMEVTGSYSIQLDGTDELDKYKNNTKEAMTVKLTGANVSGTSTAESIEIKLARLILTSPPKEYNLDGLVILTQEFTVEFDSTDKVIEVDIINGSDGTDY